MKTRQCISNVQFSLRILPTARFSFFKLLFFIICITAVNNLSAQVGISSSSITPDASSILELRSTTLGFLLPRMTTTQRDAISSPATGLAIYNTTTGQLNYYTGSAWQAVTGGGQAQLNGTGFVKASGTTISYDNSTYLTANQTITFAPTGDVTGTTTGTTSLTPALSLAIDRLRNPNITAVKTANYTASANDFVRCDNTSGSFTVTLPNAPADKTVIAVKIVVQSGSNTITIAAAGTDVFNVAGGAATLILSLKFQAFLMQYNSSDKVWVVIADDITKSSLDLLYAPIGVNGTVTQVTFPAIPAWLTASVATNTTTPAISITATTGQTANQFLATPNGSTGIVGLRSIVAADIPTLNQNTTGSAATLTTPRNIYGNPFNGSVDISNANIGVGTGTSLALTSFLNEGKGADIASAGTTDIGAATGNYVNVTGTTTITALGTVQAGTRRIVTFSGALTLTYNSTSLILPTSANITTAAGDAATFISLGSGNWKCVNYTRADGTALAGNAGTVTSVSGTANRITSTGSSTPVIDISSSYVGQSSITTLGTIGTGVWNGTAITNAYITSLAWSKITGTPTTLAGYGITDGITNANVVFNNQTNTYTAGMKQTFQTSATTAGLNLAGVTSDPSSLANGDIWHNTTTNVLKYRANGTTRIFANLDEAQVFTNKDFTSGTNTFPTFNQNTSGSAATLTTSRNIYGNAFNGSADISAIIASTYGGTGNGFTKFSGPTTSEKTFTLPNASATILTDNATVTAGQGGTGNSSYTTGDILYASASTTLSKLSGVATGNALISGGISTAPLWGKIGLTTHVSGVLPIANGGTNSTATPTSGGVAYGDGSGHQFTSAGTTGQVLQSNGTGIPAWTNGGTMMLSGNSDNVAVNNTTQFFMIIGAGVGAVADAQAGTRSLFSRAGTIENLYVVISAALGGGKTGTVTVMKNGVATSLVATLSVGPTLFSDLTHSVTVAAGDEIGIKVTTTGNVKFSYAADFTY